MDLSDEPLELPEGPVPGRLNKPSDPNAIHRALTSLRPYLLKIANMKLDAGPEGKAGASDLVHETYGEAYKNLDKFEGRSEPEIRGWLRKVLLHKILNFFRQRSIVERNIGHEVSIDQTTTDGGGGMCLIESTLSPSGQAIRNERQTWVNEALNRLEERDRMVVIWRNHENHPWEEIGRRLGGSEGMARKVWMRALVKLRDELGEPPDSLSDIAQRI